MLCRNGCGRQAGEWSNRKRARSYCSEACIREASKRYQAEYKQKHKDRLDQQEKERYQREKGHRLTRAGEYYETHTELCKARAAENGRQRRARQRQATVEAIDRQTVWERDKGICGICGEPADGEYWHLDHIVPLGPGGHTYENVRVTHPACNWAKSGEDKRVLAEWRKA